MKYVIGSDKKTVEIARDVVRLSDEARNRGDWQEAWAIVERAMRSPNRPFKAELEHQLLDGQV